MYAKKFTLLVYWLLKATAARRQRIALSCLLAIFISRPTKEEGPRAPRGRVRKWRNLPRAFRPNAFFQLSRLHAGMQCHGHVTFCMYPAIFAKPSTEMQNVGIHVLTYQ